MDLDLQKYLFSRLKKKNLSFANERTIWWIFRAIRLYGKLVDARGFAQTLKLINLFSISTRVGGYFVLC